MAYEKRVCVLKQVKKGFSADGGMLSGAVYAERLGGTLTLTPKIGNLAPLKEGRYGLAVWIGGTIFCMELHGNRPLKTQAAQSLNDGFSVLLCYLRGESEPLAYGYCGKAPVSYAALLSAFTAGNNAESKRAKRAPSAPTEARKEKGEETEETAITFCPPSCYDDEAIASADYYTFSDDENENAENSGEKKERAVSGGGDPGKDERAVHPIEFPSGKLTYYREVSERIEKAFAKFPRDERLKEAFPHSEWVNSDGVLLGVIYKEGQPRYLCVAAEKTEAGAPENMKEQAVFVPLSPYSEEHGFYVVFQDADTGEYVTVERA